MEIEIQMAMKRVRSMGISFLARLYTPFTAAMNDVATVAFSR